MRARPHRAGTMRHLLIGVRVDCMSLWVRLARLWWMLLLLRLSSLLFITQTIQLQVDVNGRQLTGSNIAGVLITCCELGTCCQPRRTLFLCT